MTGTLRAALALSVGIHASVLIGWPAATQVVFDVERAPTSVEIVLVAPAKASVEPSPQAMAPMPETTTQTITPPEPQPQTAISPEQKGAITEVLPAYLKNPVPVYPRLAREQGYEGTVLLEAEVLPSGQCGKLRLVKSSGHRILDDAATQAVATWRFKPAARAGVRVPVWVEIPITFKLLNTDGDSRWTRHS